MQEKQHTNFNHRLSPRLACIFAFLAAIYLSAVASPDSAQAASCEAERVPCIAVKFGTPEGGSQSVNPGLAYYASTKFYLPVEINLRFVSNYTVKVYGSGSDLKSGDNSIPSVLSATSYDELGQDRSEWGMRWNLGDTIEDKDANYLKIPTSAEDKDSIVVENAPLGSTTDLVKKHLTLGFAAAVKPDQASGEYTNTITVAVVASPREARSIFDIDYMQEMTTDICNNTTTPAKTATTKFDTNAKHRGDTNYVPETTLTDSRDGHTYLVRKLADGNCWMSQNLSLMLTEDGAQNANGETVALTNANTDLNSKTTWTTVGATLTDLGTTWGQNDDKIHSAAINPDQYWAGGTTFNASGTTAQGGQAGYAQRGVYYNWFAATAGSGKSTDKSTTTTQVNAPDSICPKGWMLPTGTDYANELNMTTGSTDGSVKSFYNLINLYTGGTVNKSTNSFGGTTNTLYESPMHFVPAGNYRYSNGQLTGVGERQLYWSSTATTTEVSAWHLYYLSSNVYPGTYSSDKGIGFSVRCVSR